MFACVVGCWFVGSLRVESLCSVVLWCVCSSVGWLVVRLSSLRVYSMCRLVGWFDGWLCWYLIVVFERSVVCWLVYGLLVRVFVC